MKKIKVYDLPTRLFHWSFAALFLGAFILAKTTDDESLAFSYHMLLGIVLCFLIGLRIVWGFVGSKYARFSSFRLYPRELVIYFRDLLTSRTARFPGHNPASSWAAIAMLVLGLGIGLSGYMMTQGSGKDFYEDLHELFANAFIVVIALHILGLLIHSFRHKENIALSMLDGGKASFNESLAIKSSRPFAALAFIFLVGAFNFHLIKNYDSAYRTLSTFGQTFQLGEAENLNKSGEHGEKARHRENDDDD